MPKISGPSCPHRRNPCNNARGFAIWISLLVVLLLTVLIFELDFQTRVDLRAAEHFRDDVRALHLVRSAVAAGQAFLRNDQTPQFDALTEPWATPTIDYPLGDGTLSVQIHDETAKFNLNSLVTGTVGQKQVKHAKLLYMLSLLSVPEKEAASLVASIIDWLDPPDDVENAAYLRRDPPSLPKNGPLDTLEEIRLIDGMTDTLYRKVVPYLTVYGHIGAAGATGKVNINTADHLVIRSLHEKIDEAVVAQLQQNRPYQNVGAIRTGLDNTIDQTIQSFVTVRSDTFSIEVTGRVHDVRKVARAVVRRGANDGLLYFRVE